MTPTPPSGASPCLRTATSITHPDLSIHPPNHHHHHHQQARPGGLGSVTALRAVDEDVEEITKKYGLEAGLFSIFKGKGAGEGGGQGKALQAKDLLAKYGSAYLLTSISLSLVSFGLCYALVSAGVDVPSLLAKAGLEGGCFVWLCRHCPGWDGDDARRSRLASCLPILLLDCVLASVFSHHPTRIPYLVIHPLPPFETRNL